MAAAAQAPAAQAPASKAQGSIYVGDLPKDVTEAQLFDLFSQAGPVSSVRVCRDAITRRSLGYAYVNFNTELDPNAASRALDTLNYSLIDGKPIRIMRSHRDPSQRKSSTGNVYIKNLDKTIDTKALHDTFSQFGTILSAKVVYDSNGVSKGFGFVQFETDDDAKKAIDEVNGALLEGKQVYVGPFQPKTERGGDREQSFTNVYVKGLDEAATEDDLRELCSKFGAITSCCVMTEEEGESTKCKGFGFVAFEEPSAAAAAVDALNGSEFRGKELYAGRAQKKSERQELLKNKFDELRTERMQKTAGLNLYVKNLDDEVDEDALRELFAAHGTVTSCRIMRFDNGRSKGFGFVCYSQPEEATKAITELNQSMVRGKPLYVAMAQRRDLRQQQLAQMYQGPPGMQGYGQGQMPYGAPGMMYPGMPPMGGPGFNNRGPARARVPPPAMRGAAPRVAQQPARAPAQPNGQHLTTAMLAAAPPQQQKQMLGERLYPLVHARQPQLAGKITGMLLEMEMSELLILLEDPQELSARVGDALTVLEQAGAEVAQ